MGKSDGGKTAIALPCTLAPENAQSPVIQDRSHLQRSTRTAADKVGQPGDAAPDVSGVAGQAQPRFDGVAPVSGMHCADAKGVTLVCAC